VNSGAVLVDGHNVTSITQQSLRRQIGFVPQDSFLFSGTIEDNIRDGRLDASHEEVTAAAKAAGVHDFISNLEHGYDTRWEKSGSRARQRQLVSRPF
jgi:ABC-type multidrug transport system fused ATPase/permease subunit